MSGGARVLLKFLFVLVFEVHMNHSTDLQYSSTQYVSTHQRIQSVYENNILS